MGTILLLPLAALCCWIHAERRLGFVARLATGVACIVLTGFACSFFSMFIPRCERTFHRSSLRLAAELNTKGDTQRVQQAIKAYNSIAATGTTYAASMEMWEILNHDPKP
jgi:hypothetical protein